jgi:hypothetical protein
MATRKNRPYPVCGNCEWGDVIDETTRRGSAQIPDCVEDYLADHGESFSVRLVRASREANGCLLYSWNGDME